MHSVLHSFFLSFGHSFIQLHIHSHHLFIHMVVEAKLTYVYKNIITYV